jgi:hypothetical protein
VVVEVLTDHEVNFGDYQVSGGDIRSYGFWKHQFAIATGNQGGHAQIDASELLILLDRLDTPWTTFEGMTLESSYELLWQHHAPMEIRARQQCFGSMLNYANGAITLEQMVDTDWDGVPDMTFSDAMDDALYGDDYENNKDICDSINNMNE